MQSNTNLNYQPFESLRVQRPVHRIDYLCSLVKGLRVLDLGAYDETEVTRVQHKSWKWLHREIAASAAEVLGVDSTEKLMRSGELITGPNSKIIYGNVETLTDIVKSFQPDIIVAGELIEHVEAPMPWLRHLAAARQTPCHYNSERDVSHQYRAGDVGPGKLPCGPSGNLFFQDPVHNFAQGPPQKRHDPSLLL